MDYGSLFIPFSTKHQKVMGSSIGIIGDKHLNILNIDDLFVFIYLFIHLYIYIYDLVVNIYIYIDMFIFLFIDVQIMHIYIYIIYIDMHILYYGMILVFFLCVFLEQIQGDFEVLLEETCAGRHELRDRLPFGSLSSLARSHGVIRYGQAHTAGSDALVTLDLFFRISKNDDTHVDIIRKADMESGKVDPSNGSAAAVHLKPSDLGMTRSVAAGSRVASAL